MRVRSKNELKKRAVLFSSYFALGLFTIAGYMMLIDDASFTPRKNLTLFVILVVLGVYMTANYFFRRSILAKSSVQLIVFHVLLGTIVLFVLPPTNPLPLLWIVLIILSEYYHSITSALTSLAAFVAVSSMQVVINPQMSDADILTIVARVVLLIVVVIVLDSTKRTAKDELAGLNMSLKWSSISMRRYESLINNLAEAVLAIDESHLVMVYNYELQDLLNSNEDMHNMHISQFLELADHNGQPLDLSVILPKTSVPVRRNDLYLKRHQEFVPISVSIANVHAQFGSKEAMKHTIVIRDISAEKTIENERNEFISVVSHELRTPIAIAEGNLSNAMIINERSTNDQKISESLKVTHDQIVYLATMMNDLDTLSHADKNTLDIELESVDPSQIADDMEAKYTSKAIKKNLKLFVQTKNLKPVITSREYVTTILDNLLENAIQFTETGQVVLKIENNESGLVFEVTDTGIGISKQDQSKIFDKFYRVESYERRSSGGTGLGLYISLRLAQRVNAELTVTSQEGVGSTFRLTLPSIGNATSPQSQETSETESAPQTIETA